LVIVIGVFRCTYSSRACITNATRYWAVFVFAPTVDRRSHELLSRNQVQ
jgi:hypothetical protein